MSEDGHEARLFKVTQEVTLHFPRGGSWDEGGNTLYDVEAATTLPGTYIEGSAITPSILEDYDKGGHATSYLVEVTGSELEEARAGREIVDAPPGGEDPQPFSNVDGVVNASAPPTPEIGDTSHGADTIPPAVEEAAAEEAAAAKDTNVGDLNSEDAVAYVGLATTTDELDEIEADENAGPQRKGVLEAIVSRRAELESS